MVLKGVLERVLVTDIVLVLGFLDLDLVRVTEPVLLTVRVQGSVPRVLAGVRERVLVTDTDLVRVSDTVADLVIGARVLDRVRVTEPVLDTVRVQGKVPIVLAGDLERVLVTDTVLDIGFLDRVTETLRVRVPTPVGRVLDTVGDLELGRRDLERVRVTEPVLERELGLRDLERVRVTEPVLERVMVVERVRVGDPVLEFIRRLALPPLRCS